MSGLIWSALGQSLGNAAAGVGNMMMRDAELEDRREERRRELEEQRRWREDQSRLDREARAAIAVARGGGGGGGGSAFSTADLIEGGKAEDIVAGRMGMTVPELRQLQKAQATGDVTGYSQEVTRYRRDEGTLDGEGDQYSDAVSRKNATLVEEKVKEYPPGFEREIRAKFNTLASIKESMLMGKDFKDVTEGRQNEFETGVGRAILAGQAKQGEGAGAVAGMKGQGGYKVQGNTVVNEFTGESKSTEVGESIEERNRRAPAGKGAAPASAKDIPYERLTAQAETLRKAINEASGERKQSLQSQFDEVMSELRRRRQPSGAAAAPSAAPRASGVTKGGSKYTLISE